MTFLDPARRQTTASPVLVFVLVFGALVAVTAGVWLRHPELGRVKTITRADRPSDDYYLAHDQGGHVDHHVLYFGTDRVALDHLRRADVLMLGNSRLMFAARPGVLEPYFESRGQRLYVLGFGFREADRFPLEIIRKFDLRPDLVIVNVDGFFENALSDFAYEVRRNTPFGAWKFRFESEAAHEARRAVHQLVPNWLDLFGRPGFPWPLELVIYRSRSNGTWQLSPWPHGDAQVEGRDLEVPEPAAYELAAARRFKHALAQRGARLVLTHVPTPRPTGAAPARLADLLDVPLVAAHPPGLRTEDGDHLDEPSAVAWSEAFVRQFAQAVP